MQRGHMAAPGDQLVLLASEAGQRLLRAAEQAGTSQYARYAPHFVKQAGARPGGVASPSASLRACGMGVPPEAGDLGDPRVRATPVAAPLIDSVAERGMSMPELIALARALDA